MDPSCCDELIFKRLEVMNYGGEERKPEYGTVSTVILMYSSVEFFVLLIGQVT